MTLSIYRYVTYDLRQHNNKVIYSLFVDKQYLMHYCTDSYHKKNEQEVIITLRNMVFKQPYLNDLIHQCSYNYMPQGELVHEERDTELIKKLKIKLRLKELEGDFK